MTHRACRLPLLFLCSAALAGCGGGVGSISGTVTSKGKGKPVATGNVGVLASDGAVYTGKINPDGTYLVENVPPGPAKLTVASSKPVAAGGPVGKDRGGNAGGDGSNKIGHVRKLPQEEGASPEVVKSWFPIPDKYSDPAKSGFNLEVKSGVNPFDLVLD